MVSNPDKKTLEKLPKWQPKDVPSAHTMVSKSGNKNSTKRKTGRKTKKKKRQVPLPLTWNLQLPPTSFTYCRSNDNTYRFEMGPSNTEKKECFDKLGVKC